MQSSPSLSTTTTLSNHQNLPPIPLFLNHAKNPPIYQFSFPTSSLPQFLPRTLSLHASKQPKTSPLPSRNDDDAEGFEEIEFEDGEFEEEEENDEELLGFEKMRSWERNKPRGFGEGKVYDTSVEARLVEEIEQSRKAQMINIQNLKQGKPNNKGSVSQRPAAGKEKEAGSEVTEDVIQVRINNLPKKKNIHRDLQSAFKGFRGLLNINAAVTGNKKTRDPICKGFAFVTFVSEVAATRFVTEFSGKSIPFGRIEKPIACELSSSTHCADSNSAPAGATSTGSRLKLLPHNTRGFNEITDHGITRLDSYDVMSSLGISVTGTVESLEAELNNGDNLEAELTYGENQLNGLVIEEPEEISCGLTQDGNCILDDDMVSSSSKPKRVNKKQSERKKSSKEVKLKNLKLTHVLRSANRLKVKEKAVLTDVFAKYGTNAGFAKATTP